MKKYFLALVLLFGLVSSLGGVACADEIDKCLNYIKSQDYQLALQAGREAVALYPNNVGAHLCLGTAYCYLDNFNSSIGELKTAEEPTSYQGCLDKCEENYKNAINWCNIGCFGYTLRGNYSCLNYCYDDANRDRNECYQRCVLRYKL